jgi:glutathione peroxidase
MIKKIILSVGSILGISACHGQGELKETSLYDFTVKSISGKDVALSQYKGKVMLIVNVASKCGLTPQYKDLEALYQKYKDQGLVILGFPANNFLWQEPGDDSTIQSFCKANYGVSFDMFSKISVKGSDQAPLYQFLTQKKYNKLEDHAVSWNFQKFLVNKEGQLVRVIEPRTKVSQEEVIQWIESELKK